MAIYEFSSTAGVIREVEASMTTPPPERIVFVLDGWRAAGEHDRDVFARVWTVPAMSLRDGEAGRAAKGGITGTTYAGERLPISRALPRKKMNAGRFDDVGQGVFRHKDGTLTDRRGRQVIDSKSAVDRATKAHNMVRVDRRED